MMMKRIRSELRDRIRFDLCCYFGYGSIGFLYLLEDEEELSFSPRTAEWLIT